MLRVKTTDVQVYRGRQDYNFVEELTVYDKDSEKTYCLKLHIHVDSIDFQSRFVIKVFNMETLDWNVLASIPYKVAECVKVKLYYGRQLLTKEEHDAVRADRAKLITKGVKTLFPRSGHFDVPMYKFFIDIS